jgi:aminoglycoside phosphotransferase (APT) family kinase protein
MSSSSAASACAWEADGGVACGGVSELEPHLVSLPDADGLERMATALGGGEIRDLVRLTGGLDCATHAFTLDGRRLVLKRSRPEQHSAAREFENLRLAWTCDVPTPAPLALDVDGAWFATDAVVMSAVPGALEMVPADLGLWCGELARALYAIQRRDPVGVTPSRPPQLVRWTRPKPAGEDSRLDAVATVVDRLRALDHGSPVFTHTDYHPGNVLFEGGRLSGVVDWMFVDVEPRQLGVSKTRSDLAVYPGGAAPSLFLAAYEALHGASLEHLPRWDALMATKPYLWGFSWAPSFADVGIDLSADEITARASAFLDDALVLALEP